MSSLKDSQCHTGFVRWTDMLTIRSFHVCGRVTADLKKSGYNSASFCRGAAELKMEEELLDADHSYFKALAGGVSFVTSDIRKHLQPNATVQAQLLTPVSDSGEVNAEAVTLEFVEGERTQSGWCEGQTSPPSPQKHQVLFG